ncbi:MAG: hypothetical protein K2Y71_11325 [Xanthobacteraceae bacterium]|nr:hypothetical protein [Xanthobacteraceae bacterium]
MAAFRDMLAGGHPNSLGRTVAVVALVLRDRSRLQELFACYQSDDAVVRMRTSNALKRIEAERHDWLVPLIDRLIDKVGALDQPSAQWTLAQLFLRLGRDMSDDQRARAVRLLKRNLDRQDDWIVLNMTMETLFQWSRNDTRLRRWLKPRLSRLARDPRTSVAKRAKKLAARDKD